VHTHVMITPGPHSTVHTHTLEDHGPTKDAPFVVSEVWQKEMHARLGLQRAL